MQASPAHLIADTAAHLHQEQPQLPALELLDRVLRDRRPDALDFTADLVAPPSQFGQLIAAAFDSEMTPDEWSAWAGADADLLLRDALLSAWTSEVLPRFTARYGLPAI